MALACWSIKLGGLIGGGFGTGADDPVEERTPTLLLLLGRVGCIGGLVVSLRPAGSLWTSSQQASLITRTINPCAQRVYYYLVRWSYYLLMEKALDSAMQTSILNAGENRPRLVCTSLPRRRAYIRIYFYTSISTPLFYPVCVPN